MNKMADSSFHCLKGFLLFRLFFVREQLVYDYKIHRCVFIYGDDSGHNRTETSHQCVYFSGISESE